ncbi:hypothetical protein OROHE_018650 [Orobanche hederae]
MQLRAARYLVTQRPWLDLYGINVKPVAPFPSLSSKPFVDTALIHLSLPDELLLEIFSRVTPYTLGRASCVCRKWRYTIRNPVFWRNACLRAWQLIGVVETYKLLQAEYHGSWRKMWLLRPRLRTDGLYVSRNTYIRAGVAEWKTTNPVHISVRVQFVLDSDSPPTRLGFVSDAVGPRPDDADLRTREGRSFRRGHLFFFKRDMNRTATESRHLQPRQTDSDTLSAEVCYFRYLRFYPSGRFLYKNSSQKIKDVVKYMNFRSSKGDCVFSGQYTLSEDKVEAAVLYHGMRPTVLRIRLRLRGTTQGANNRMDLLSLVTSGVNDAEASGPGEDILGVVEGWQEDETHNPDVPAISHKRGFTPFVFVSFEEVITSVLNLPVEKMDYFVPG